MEDEKARAEHVRELLEELHRVLGEGAGIDATLEEDLRGVLGEVREALDAARTASGAPAGAAEASLEQRFEALALEFEAAHPTLAGLLNRLTHQLSSLGI